MIYRKTGSVTYGKTGSVTYGKNGWVRTLEERGRVAQTVAWQKRSPSQTKKKACGRWEEQEWGHGRIRGRDVKSETCAWHLRVALARGTCLLPSNVEVEGVPTAVAARGVEREPEEVHVEGLRERTLADNHVDVLEPEDAIDRERVALAIGCGAHELRDPQRPVRRYCRTQRQQQPRAARHQRSERCVMKLAPKYNDRRNSECFRC